jgi:hypothetical protein
MTNQELEALLRNSRPPAWPPHHWETFPARVVQRLQEPGTRTGTVQESRRVAPTRLIWPALAAAACIVVGLWLGPRSPREGLDPSMVTASARLFSELTELFPNTLRAVITNGEQNRIVLSDGNRVGGTEPVLLRLCDNGDCVTIVTFSGEEIEVGPLKFEVLAGGKDEVLLVGEDFVWSRRDSSGLRGWPHVEATTLSGVL